jgi:hypothetical protein
LTDEAVTSSAEDFGRQPFLRTLGPGPVFAEYTDDTHLPRDQWVRLARIQLYRRSLPGAGGFPRADTSPLFTVCSALSPTRFTKADKGEKGDPQRLREEEVLTDQLAQSLLRCGAVRPRLDPIDFQKVALLAQRKSAIIVPDTNALYNGSIHWLLRSLVKTHVWLLPVVVSLTQVQQRDTKLKELHHKQDKTGNPRQSVRSRALIDHSLSLLEKYRHHYQVLEVDPQLLRYVRPAGGGTADSDSGDVLEDRLLVEAIHAVFQSTRSAVDRVVVTADVMLARILNAEAINFLLLQPPILKPGVPVPSVRYEPIAGEFQGATLPGLLWDLAHSFGTIRLTDENGRELVRLEAYWARKGVHDWIAERLNVYLPVKGGASPSRPAPGAVRPAAVARSPVSPVPYVSLPPVLSLVSELNTKRSGRLGDLTASPVLGKRPSAEIARKAADLLVASGFASAAEKALVATPLLDTFCAAWKRGDLDGMSSALLGYRPYALGLQHLKSQGALRWKTVTPAAKEDFSELGQSISKYTLDYLLRYCVYLGQAWTERSQVRDGSRRPSDHELIGALDSSFQRVQEGGLASVSLLLVDLCTTLRTSPWFVRKAITGMIESGRLPQYVFSPSLGKTPVGRDFVVAPLGAATLLEKVPTDRLSSSLGPILTMARKHE